MLKIILVLLALVVIVSPPQDLVAQEIPVIFVNPGEELAANGIDTTDISSIRALFDRSASPMSPYAALFLAQGGYVDIGAKIGERVAQILGSESPFAILSLPSYLTALYLLRDVQTIPLLQTSLDTLLARRERGVHRGVTEINDVLTMMVNLGDYSRFSVVKDLLRAPDQFRHPGIVRIVAAYASSQELRPLVYAEVKGLLTHPDKVFRFSAVRELGKFKNHPETQGALRQVALSDRDYTVREEAIVSLFAIYRDFDYVLRACEDIAVDPSDSVSFRWSVNWIQYVNLPNALMTLMRIREKLPEGYRREYVSREIESYEPPRPLLASQELTLAASLDSLISQKHQTFALGWLGDKNFVKELDDGLENARKHLAKGDSVNTYKEVQKVQEKIQKEYDRTQENEKKNKPRDKRFVTTEGYKFLYFNAKYILDRLPGEKTKKK